jgi:hypothetical protein
MAFGESAAEELEASVDGFTDLSEDADRFLL